jgi:hypothetical protein
LDSTSFTLCLNTFSQHFKLPFPFSPSLGGGWGEASFLNISNLPFPFLHAFFPNSLSLGEGWGEAFEGGVRLLARQMAVGQFIKRISGWLFLFSSSLSLGEGRGEASFFPLFSPPFFYVHTHFKNSLFKTNCL